MPVSTGGEDAVDAAVNDKATTAIGVALSGPQGQGQRGATVRVAVGGVRRAVGHPARGRGHTIDAVQILAHQPADRHQVCGGEGEQAGGFPS